MSIESENSALDAPVDTPLTGEDAVEHAILNDLFKQTSQPSETPPAPAAKEETPAETPASSPPVVETPVAEVVVEHPFKEVLSQYQIAEDKLPDVLKAHSEQARQLAEMKAQLESSKLKSDKQQKIFDFLSRHVTEDTSLDEGLRSYARLMEMDVTKMDDREALRELYILENSDLDRDKALRLFESEYEEKYETGSDLAEIKRERDSRKARTELARRKAEFTAKPAPTQAEDPQVALRISASQARHQQEWKAAIKDFAAYQLVPDNLKEEPMSLVIAEADRLQIQQQLDSVIANPDFYDEQGNLYGGFNPEKHKEDISFGLIGKKMLSAVAKHYYDRGREARAKEISKQTPTRQSAGAPQVSSAKSEAEAIEAAILAMK